MIYIIAAFDKNLLIGNKGKLPWKIEGELNRFKSLTTNNVVIMGRISYEEIGKPLPNRTTIVVSNTKKFYGENCFTVNSLQEAILKTGHKKDIYIAGGTRLYQEALPIVDKMYITEIHSEFEGDTYFPYFQKELFIREVNCRFGGDIPYDYVTYTRKSVL